VNNYAFIDGQNLKLAIKSQGWSLDFIRYRKYLLDKYQVEKAYIFLGYLPENEKKYDTLRRAGFELIFKPVMRMPNGQIKGNVDAELVLHTMIQYKNFDKAMIVSNDGDFYCLAEYLKGKSKLLKIMIPDRHTYSSLLQPFGVSMVFMNELKIKLAKRKRGIILRTKP
jgi:uncharacterized LabA/DUF88 family protein